VTVMGLLAQAGAQHVLISNAPDLGKTPEAVALGLVSQSTAASLAFNSALIAGENLLDATFFASTGIDLDIRTLDLFGVSEAIFDDAVNHGGSTFGITNVTTPCIAPGAVSGEFFAPDAVAVACDVAAFSDPLHPSAAVHRLIGEAALSAAGIVQVPEPGTLALVLCALVIVGVRAEARESVFQQKPATKR